MLNNGMILQIKRQFMKAIKVEIPNYKTVNIAHIVLDYNGTLAEDGILKEGARVLLQELSTLYSVHVITADTFGSVHKQVEAFNLTVKVLESDDHTKEKAAYVEKLGSVHCAAVGNGNNDVGMIEKAAVGIALLGDEGCATATFMKSDMVCKNIEDALRLFVKTKRLTATLRK